MLLKKLVTDYNISIDHILIKKRKELGLEVDEAYFLIEVLEIFKNKGVLTLTAALKKTTIKKKDCENLVERLITKEIISIEVDKVKEQVVEVLDLGPLFNLIEKVLNEDGKIKLNPIQEIAINVDEAIKLYENICLRQIYLDEIDQIKSIYKNERYSHEIIIYSLKKLCLKSNNKISPKLLVDQIEMELI